MWKYIFWVPLTLLYNYLMCWVAIKYNNKDFWLNYFFLTLFGLIPTWALASYFSNNLIFDGLLFDVILVISSVIFFAILGKAEHFSLLNWIGVVTVILGLILARI